YSVGVGERGETPTVAAGDGRPTQIARDEGCLFLPCFFRLPGGDLFRCGALPNLDKPTLPTCGNPLAIPRKDGVIDPPVVPFQHEHFTAARTVPEPGGAIFTAGKNPFGVGRENQRLNIRAMSLESVYYPPSGRFPKQNRAVLVTRDDPLAIRRERAREHLKT